MVFGTFEYIVLMSLKCSKSYWSTINSVKARTTDATSRNIIARCWPTMLRPLYRPKSLTDFILCATSANIVVVPCKRTQHVGPNNVASVCMDLYTPRNKWIACVTTSMMNIWFAGRPVQFSS